MPDVKKLRGKAWVFGDLMDVDWEICPFDIYSQLKNRGIPHTEEEYGKHCMTMVDAEFPRKVQRGDFIIGGENFGYGHDHHHASLSIKGAGVAAVIAESSNVNFIRNSIHLGLPVIVCSGIKQKVKQGEMLEVDLAGGTIKNLTTSAELRFPPFPGFLLDILAAGGVYPAMEREIKAGRA